MGKEIQKQEKKRCRKFTGRFYLNGRVHGYTCNMYNKLCRNVRNSLEDL